MRGAFSAAQKVLMTSSPHANTQPSVARALAVAIIEAEPCPEGDARSGEKLLAAVRGAAQVLRGLLGEVGTQALLARAVHLARRAASGWQPAVTIQHLSDVESWQRLIEQHGAAAAQEQAEVLLEHAITLVCGFIGAGLTLRVFKRSYPEFRADEVSNDPAEGQDS
jgi:hypothetical protein